VFAVPPVVTRLTAASITIVYWGTSGAIFARFAYSANIKSCIATVPKPTNGSLPKLVDVKPIAPLYLNVGMPLATV